MAGGTYRRRDAADIGSQTWEGHVPARRETTITASISLTLLR